MNIRLPIASCIGVLAFASLAHAQSEIRDAGGKRLLCIDADGETVRKEPSGPRLLHIDSDGSIRKEPTSPRILFVDGEDVRENPGGVRIAVIDGDGDIRRAPTSPVLMNYKHPDIGATSASKREYSVDGKELTRPQLAAVLHILNPKLFELSKEETDRKSKEMKQNAEAEEKRLAADRAVGKFDILTASEAPKDSGRVIVAAKQGDCYQMKIEHKGGPEWTGVGVQYQQKDQDRWFMCAFGTPKTVGLGVYEIKGGTLEGKWYNGWSDADPKNTGMENMKGPESLDGQFVVTAGKTPHDGIEYAGACVIKPVDENVDGGFKVYSLTWTLGGKDYYGIGLRSKEGKLYVAMGTGEAFNIAAFKLGTNGEMIGDFLSNKKVKGIYTTSKQNQ